MLSGSNQAFMLIYQLAVMVGCMEVMWLSDCGCEDHEIMYPKLFSHLTLVIIHLKIPKK